MTVLLDASRMNLNFSSLWCLLTNIYLVNWSDWIAQTKQSCHFIKLKLNQWSYMDDLNDYLSGA